MEPPYSDALEIAKLARDDIHKIEDVLVWIAIPLALIPPVPTSWRWIWLRTLVITIPVWYVIHQYRIDFEVPWNTMVLDIQDPNSDYDGVGVNAALLLFGWIPPFFECLGTLIVCRYLLLWLRSGWRRDTEKEDKGKANTHEIPRRLSAAIDKKKFQVTTFISSADIVARPEALASVFPELLLDKIRTRAGVQ